MMIIDTNLFIQLLLFVLLVASLVFVGRIILVLAGMHKGPLLRVFEPYGFVEPYYNPLPALLFWFGMLLFTTGVLREGIERDFGTTDLFAVFFFTLAWLSVQFNKGLRALLERLPTLPRWYGHLLGIAERVERRRIAYMWLRLPLRLRLLYNTNDRAFFLWAEMVIMATIHEA